MAENRAARAVGAWRPGVLTALSSRCAGAYRPRTHAGASRRRQPLRNGVRAIPRSRTHTLSRARARRPATLPHGRRGGETRGGLRQCRCRAGGRPGLAALTEAITTRASFRPGLPTPAREMRVGVFRGPSGTRRADSRRPGCGRSRAHRWIAQLWVAATPATAPSGECRECRGSPPYQHRMSTRYSRKKDW